MTTTAIETIAADTNSHGFPLVPCYRCKGAGTYSWNARTGTTCFACDGAGKAVRRGKASRAWAAYQQAMAEASSKPWAEVQPGEAVYADPMRPNRLLVVDTITEDTLNGPGHLRATFTSGRLILGTRADFTVRTRYADASRLPDAADYARGL